MRRFHDLVSEDQRAVIGHNGGPPLDVSYKAWVWRKAHAKAWQSPGREIVMLRMRRAERLGLSYEAYTSVILDRGARLEGVIAMPSAGRLRDAAAKLATLSDCCIMLAAGETTVVPDALRKIVTHITMATSASAAIKHLMQASKLAPSTVFFVGPETHRRVAEQAGLGLFLDEKLYFGCR